MGKTRPGGRMKSRMSRWMPHFIGRYAAWVGAIVTTIASHNAAFAQPVELDFTQPTNKQQNSGQKSEIRAEETPLHTARALLARAQRLEEQANTSSDDLAPLFDEACEAYRRVFDSPIGEFADVVLENATACRGANRAVEAAQLCVRATDDKRAGPRRAELWLCGVYAYRHAIKLAENVGKLPVSGALDPALELVRNAVSTFEKLKEESIGAAVEPETRLRVLYLAAELRERMGQRDVAESLYWFIIRAKPGLELAEAVTAQLLGPSQNSKNWTAVADILEQLREVELATQRETQKYRNEWGEWSSALAVRRAQEAENANKWDDAAVFRHQAASVATQVADVARARYQAAYALDKASRMVEARAAYEAILREFPDSDVVPLAMLSLGTVALKLHDPAAAAQLFVSYSERYPSGEHAVDALLQGVQLWVEDNRLVDAAGALERFLGRNATDQEIPTRLFLADLYEKTGALDKGLSQYETVLSRTAVSFADQVMVHARAGLLSERLNKTGLAQKHFAAAIKIADENGIAGVWSDRCRAKLQR